MKKYIIAGVIALISISFAFSSCNKYEDGPKVSLLTKKMRLTNTWTIEKVFYFTNSTQSTSDITDVTLANYGADNKFIVEKNETYSSSSNLGSDSGSWRLGEDKDDILTTSSSAGSVEQSARILKLKSKELWLRVTLPNADQVITHYKPF